MIISPHMREVGRNERCPCGSGKKYKRCHGLEQAPVGDLLWRQIRGTRDSLVNQLLEHSVKTFGREKIYEAWEDWCFGEESPFDPESPEIVMFLPWFLYEWIPEDALDLDALDDESKDYPIAWSFKKKRVGYLSPIERQYLEQADKEAFSFFEILEIRPGEGFKLRDILTDRQFQVSERMGSQNVEVGSFLFGKVVQIDRIAVLDACSDIMFPMDWKITVLQLKQGLKKESGGPLTVDDLVDYDPDIRSLYREMRERAVNPKPPQLTNTDGEPLSFHKLIFDLDAPEAVFEKLHVMTFSETKETLLEGAERDSSGKLINIEFPWLKRGNRANKGASNTVLAHLTIEQGKLTVDVNSAERAQKAKKKVEQLAGSLVRYKTTLIEPLEAKLKESRARSSATVMIQKSEEQAELMKDPEIRAKIQEMTRKHLESWGDQKIPALGNRTPKQAVKTPEGREMVETLLKDFERSAAVRDDDGFELGVIQGLWGRLGLKRP